MACSSYSRCTAAESLWSVGGCYVGPPKPAIVDTVTAATVQPKLSEWQDVLAIFPTVIIRSVVELPCRHYNVERSQFTLRFF